MTVSDTTFTSREGQTPLRLGKAQPIVSAEEQTQVRRGISPIITRMLDEHPTMTWFLLGRFPETVSAGDCPTALSRVAVPLYREREGPCFGTTGLFLNRQMWGLGWNDISDFGRRRMPARLRSGGLVPTLRLDILDTSRTWLLWRLT